jgi:UDP-2,3-diacylglucosamine pyrophosphatase LpxH/biotin operon repressor
MTWRKKAIEMYRARPADEKTPWKSWARRLTDEYGKNVTHDAVRGVCLRAGRIDSSGADKKTPTGARSEREGQVAEIKDKLLAIVSKNPVSVAELSRIFACSERVLLAHVDDLRESGYILTVDGGQVSLVKNAVIQQEVPCRWDGDKIIRFGVVCDPHLCSKHQQLTLLHNFYDILEAEGIEETYVGGDLSEGHKMRPGHEHDVFCHGADDQVRYIVKHWPRRRNMKNRFILGNHDYAHVKNGGHDIGVAIANERDDMEYLGMLNAVVPLTPNTTLEINHPLDGASYATSYSVQKYIDSYHGGEKPNFLINGHHHKALYGLYRNVHYVEGGTFQMQSGWMKGKRIAAHVGGWIVELRLDDDAKISRVKTEWIPYYVFKHNDY